MKQQLTVGIIGAGPVGCVLGRALASAGHLIVGIATTDARNQERADALIPGVAIKPAAELIELADLILLAIPAGQLAEFVAGVATAGLWRQGQLVVHTAAEFGLEVLNPATNLGVIPLAIHPAMAFTGTNVDVSRIHESFFAVSAPAVALPIAQALVIEMGAEPVVITEAQRPKYVEAIGVATNFSALLANQAIGLLKEIGIEDARGLIAPVIYSSVERALADGYVQVDPDELLEP
ncbi:MAG: hypothetical protein RLZZ164_260 [Actinomycetota bacterium]